MMPLKWPARGTVVFLVVSYLMLASAVWAQSFGSSPPQAKEREQQTVLLGVLKSMEQVEQDIQRLQSALRSPDTADNREELRKQLQQQRGKLEALRKDFGAIASSVDVSVFFSSEPPNINWQERLLELLRPVLNELTRLTAGPREIEQLRTQIAGYDNQLRAIGQGVANMAQLADQSPDATLTATLNELRNNWKTWQQEIDTHLQIANQQLQRKLDDQPSIQESAKHLLQLFFRSRGRNFVVACAAFLAFWLISHRLFGVLEKLPFLSFERRSFPLRLFHVVYTMFSAVGAVFGFLLVLYIYKDWVLLTLAILFLVGIAWTSKETLPRFIREVMLLLNIGAVRESERVVYNGIPWLVKTLSVHTSLVNPELVGGQLHLPLRDLHNLRSRPFKPDEPWFPTRLNDWVLLNDQTLGKVILQSPEMVRLVLLGGSQRTLSTSDFLAQSPNVLSTGFRLEVTFGLDYRHQDIITADIPAQLTPAVHRALSAEGHDHDLVNLSVEFSEAGASSLDLKVLADFSGEAAPRYYTLRRAIQRSCVDACNAHAWVIPFTQLTLHMPTPAIDASWPLPNGAIRDDNRESNPQGTSQFDKLRPTVP